MAAERSSTKGGRPLKVTWVRSTIGHKAAARGTIRALGLHRLNQTVEVADSPMIRGMLRRVDFLVDVEETSGSRGVSAKEEESK